MIGKVTLMKGVAIIKPNNQALLIGINKLIADDFIKSELCLNLYKRIQNSNSVFKNGKDILTVEDMPKKSVSKIQKSDIDKVQRYLFDKSMELLFKDDMTCCFDDNRSCNISEV